MFVSRLPISIPYLLSLFSAWMICVWNVKLQAMMKDPFGNYVVQKVLETCNDRSLELILSRIRVHLSALKRYTYGKHIVSRVEKLITTGGENLCSNLLENVLLSFVWFTYYQWTYMILSLIYRKALRIVILT